MVDYKKYISIDPNIRFGRPYLSGTRILVHDVLSWLANGMTLEEIKTNFPELTTEHIQACLAFAVNKEHTIRVA